MWDTVTAELTNTFSEVPLAVTVTRLVAALILGAVIGIEREWRAKPAGLRTHMLISIAACLFILVSQNLGNLSFGAGNELRIDPLRLVEAVTAGVAFLAAGVIFTAGDRVRNLTTGASMWLAGAIGLACGAGQTPLAALATLLVAAVLIVLRRVEDKMGAH